MSFQGSNLRGRWDVGNSAASPRILFCSPFLFLSWESRVKQCHVEDKIEETDSKNLRFPIDGA